MTESASVRVSIEDGEWAGWSLWPAEPFERIAGPFYLRPGDDPVCAFRVTEQHLNAGGSVHGGCLMTFADFAIFGLSEAQWSGRSAVTVSMNCDFLGPARIGDLVEAMRQSIHATRTMIFVSGLAVSGSRPVLSFNGIIKLI